MSISLLFCFWTTSQVLLSSRQKKFRIPANVHGAYSKCQKAKKALYHQHRQFATRLRVDAASIHTRDDYVATIPSTTLSQLTAEYPPHRRDVCETEEIKTVWTEYRHGRPHPDRREAKANGGSWPSMVILDETKLQKVVGEDESIIIYDSETQEVVAVVLRDVCGDPGVLEWVTGVIQENVGWRRNVRVCTFTFLQINGEWLTVTAES